MKREQWELSMAKYVPTDAVGLCVDLLQTHKVHLKITRSRLSKYGDYRAPYKSKGHRISINHNLNSYTFLVTFLHEMAHLIAISSHSYSIDPHGKEWKNTFKGLMNPLLETAIFPEEINKALQNYLVNPAASGCGDPILYKALKKYDPDNSFEFLENLPEGCHFKIKGYANTFVKGKLLRKTFHCRMQDSKREFRISAIAQVQQVSLF